MAGRGGPIFDGARRLEMADAFQTGGADYDRVRPGYPQESLDWLLDGAETVHDVLDVGAGTGKYTRLLTDRGWRVSAVDPSADMLTQLLRKLPETAVASGTAEHLPLPDLCMDLAVVAQAWHWCDPLAASTELARVLRPGGTLGLIWNQLDVGVPWVHRLARIMHAGDVHKPDFHPNVGIEFTGLAAHETRWEQSQSPDEVIELATSRSYYLKAGSETRAKVLSNLSWYLYEHLGHTPQSKIALPYLTHTWRARRSSGTCDTPFELDN
ncbi:class I SAM-dependent methyltransferase [Arthrobacter cryoconiti]|uniref:Class I SAM-dependent methyltransferase n=1 Tax=Arthrobacter cryoconiti TaxID=748907 RepID=A0ABV8QX22_9MICC|nr:class I SAM-dependent methyltransferase [Arthrobacter cryoconiti]MCC9068980.1 class I SAM-dependent methyltransferase [Arthrobacter cryoconiti]